MPQLSQTDIGRCAAFPPSIHRLCRVPDRQCGDRAFAGLCRFMPTPAAVEGVKDEPISGNEQDSLQFAWDRLTRSRQGSVPGSHWTYRWDLCRVKLLSEFTGRCLCPREKQARAPNPICMPPARDPAFRTVSASERESFIATLVVFLLSQTAALKKKPASPGASIWTQGLAKTSC